MEPSEWSRQRALPVFPIAALGRKAHLPGIDVSLVLVVKTASSLGTCLDTDLSL